MDLDNDSAYPLLDYGNVEVDEVSKPSTRESELCEQLRQEYRLPVRDCLQLTDHKLLDEHISSEALVETETVVQDGNPDLTLTAMYIHLVSFGNRPDISP